MIVLPVKNLWAQIDILLPQTNIIQRTEVQQTGNIGKYSYLLSLLPSIYVKATSQFFTSTSGNGATVPLNIAHLKIQSINGVLVLNNNVEITLAQNEQDLMSSLAQLNLAGSGPVIANFRLTTANQTWVSGIYETSLGVRATGVLGGKIDPPETRFTLNVPAFITAPTTIGTTSLLVNNLSFYRSANGISSNTNIPLSCTVPYLPAIRTNNASQFNFSSSLPYNNSPIVPVSTVNVNLTGIPSATTIPLSSSDQALTTAASLAVPNNNNTSLTYTFSIPAAQLKNSFIQAGTYAVPLRHNWSSVPTNSTTAAQATGSLEIVVNDLSELVINPAQQAINFAFTTTDHYKNGISQDMPAHLKLSKTTPYNLYVRATSPSFNSGANTIPLDIMRIGPATGETGINTITLSATAQKLIDSANPVIDRNIGIRYSIPASETGKLLNKPAGTYSSTIVFSFTAP
ncbi:MAG: hypothetical protein LBF27_30210 [Sphingobacterium sp.]|jgi:hypothetical protein|nr:hypothetical protein [Sphingobacterium sp.]